jgi:predicted kinase
MSNTLTILCGLPGSGKSTIAKRLHEKDPENTLVVNADSLRTMIYAGTYDYNQAHEKLVKDIMTDAVEMALLHGFNVVVDSTNLTRYEREDLVRMTEGYGPWVHVIVMPLNVELCKTRRAKDTKGLPPERWASVIDAMMDRVESVMHDKVEYTEIMYVGSDGDIHHLKPIRSGDE